MSTAYQLLASEPVRSTRCSSSELVRWPGWQRGLPQRRASSPAPTEPSRAERLAEAVGGKAVALSELPRLAETDVVTCTGARTFTIGVEDLAGTPVRGVVDLALPADVAPEVVEHGICLVNLDRLVTEQPDAASAQEVEDAARLVREEVADFWACAERRPGRPDGCPLRSWPLRSWPANCAGWTPGCRLDDHERDRSSAAWPSSTSCCTLRPYGAGAVGGARRRRLCGRPARALRARPADRRRSDVTRGQALMLRRT